MDQSARALKAPRQIIQSEVLDYKSFQILFPGKIGIDLERKLVINDEKDPEVWKPPTVDENELREAKKFAAPERKVSSKANQ